MATYILQNADNPTQWLVWQPGRNKVMQFEATEEQFRELMERLRETDPDVRVLAAA